MAPRLILIRHGQASFGSDDYDRLSDLGHRQAELLGQALAETDLRPDMAVIGGQLRHRQTFDGIAKGFAPLPEPRVDDGLNEFDGDGLVAAWRADQNRPATARDDRAGHFADLRRAMLDWQAGGVPGAPESWTDFRARVTGALTRITREAPGDGTVIAVSSGGPISTLVAEAMGAAPATQADLQMQMHNGALTRMVLSRRGPILQTYNENLLARGPDAGTLVTYS